MMERHEHTNPWADKLQEVQLPDANDSWNVMQVLLDKEMPSGGQYDKRRWLLVILLLLLLIGVCNCPRQGRWAHRGSSGPLPVSGGTASTVSDSSARIAGAHRSVGPNPGVVKTETHTIVGVPDSPVGQSETRRSLRPVPDGGMSVTDTTGGVPASRGLRTSGGIHTPAGRTRGAPGPNGTSSDKSGGSRPAAPSGTSTENSIPSGVSAAVPPGNAAVSKKTQGTGGENKEASGARGPIGRTGTTEKVAIRRGIPKKVTGEKDIVEKGTSGNEEVKGNTGGMRVMKKGTGGKGIVKKSGRRKGSGENIPDRKDDEKKERKNIAGRTGPGLRSGMPAKRGTPGTRTAPGTSGIAGAPVTAGTSTTPGTPGAMETRIAPGAPGIAGDQVAPGTPVTTGTQTTPGTSGITGAPTTGGTLITAGTTTTSASAAGKKGKDPAVAGPAKPGRDTIAKKKPGAAADNKQTPASKKAKEDTIAIEPDVYGWVAGIGFNQFFSVGQQQKSDYNSGGTTGGIGDYLPIPMVRYYFSRKLFVQMEAQFNAPQFTKKDLVAGESAGVTLPSGHVQQNSVVVKKLFYFNLPVSVHYSPIKNLYLGAGLQYSRLSNGVGLYEDKVLVPGGPDTVKAAKVYSFKGDSIYQKMRTNEFRVLLDLNYTYKRFIIGARYNQALSKFINVHISDTQVTQARNSSLQLYIRCILWDGRKRKALSSK